jgi:DNA-binding NarL/FixJ family response regulator
MIAPSDNPISVAIADDHALMRNALANLVKRKNNYEVIFLAENGQELLNHIASNGLPDIILLDINMPVMDGFETMAILKRKYRNAKVVALSTYNDYSSIFRMYSLGINAYLFKTFEADDILLALDMVCQNGQWFPDQVNSKLMHAAKDDVYHKIALMKERELTFLKLACTGISYKDIASNMHVSRFTIDDYRSSLYNKFDLSNRMELVLFALKYKLVEIE